jgi:hypothetical protein
MYRTHIALFVFALIGNVAIAEDDTSWNRLTFQAGTHYGRLLPHHKTIAYFLEDPIKGFELNAGLQTDGSKYWHKHYNYPKIGLGIYHSNLGNNNIFGKITSVYGFLDRRYFPITSRINFSSRLDFGVSYISKKYDLYNNSFDVAISSHLNVFINLSGVLSARLTEHWRMNMGVGVSHASNGRYNEPNKGFNLCTGFVGLEYSLAKINRPFKSIPVDDSNVHKNQFLISFSYGRKQISRRYAEHFSVEALSLEYGRRISPTHFLGFSLNTYYDPSIIKELKAKEEKYHQSDSWRVSFNPSFDMQMGKLSYVFQPGIYLLNKYKEDGNLSNRIGLRYQLPANLTASVFIKAHWPAVADFIEWGIGYNFKN